MEVKKFKHNDEDYEVRIETDEETVFVKAFKDNKPINPFRYTASFEIIDDMKIYLETDAVKHLIGIAKQDVINNIK